MKPEFRKGAWTVMKRSACVVLFAVAGAAAGAEGSHAGKITVFHLNGDVAGRGLCVQMDPPVPVTGAWACLLKANPLYKEITAMLMAGHASGKSCRVAWSDNPWALTWAECY